MATKLVTGQSKQARKRPAVSPQSRLPAPERRKLLMHYALQCFSRSSYHTTSMDEIGAAAGVTKPVIYRHFSSKRQLYSDLIRDTGDELCLSIRSATDRAESLQQRVELGFEAYFRFACESRAGYELLFGSGPRRDPEFRDAVINIENEIADLVASKIEADIDETHRRFLALGVISLAEGTVRRWLATLDPLEHPPLEPISYDETDAGIWAKRVTELAWAGLRGIRRTE
ncbi:MAG: TetR/AcrR family transcriptional regulator [Acidimicrobiaceae bacterium]|nr:TetR/AcrR family transcriptional regulator [Acidimicrobiaceae bacterium]